MKRTITAAALAAAAIFAAGCSNVVSSSFQNVPVTREIKGPAVRIDTPGNFPAAVLMCQKSGDGVYTAESTGGSVFVLAHDPSCPQPVPSRTAK